MSKKGGFCCAWHIKAYLPQSYKLAVSLEREALEMCAASRLQWVWWSNCSPQWTAQHITESLGRALITPSHGAYTLADARSQDWPRSGGMLFFVQTLTLFFCVRFTELFFFSPPTLVSRLWSTYPHLVFSLSSIRHSAVIYMTISSVCVSPCCSTGHTVAMAGAHCVCKRCGESNWFTTTSRPEQRNPHKRSPSNSTASWTTTTTTTVAVIKKDLLGFELLLVFLGRASKRNQ